jgi:hypothetical protein
MRIKMLFLKSTSLVALILAAGFCLTLPAHAKRIAPKPVPPVVSDGIEYSAPLNRIGFVVATWNPTKREIWSRQVYVIKHEYKLGLELDVQDVFITDLRLEGGLLKIKNERGGEFELDLESLNVKVLQGQAVIDFTQPRATGKL